VIKSLVVVIGSSVPGRVAVTSVEEMPDHNNKAGKYYYANWFVRD
jgi:hypothetical protein